MSYIALPGLKQFDLHGRVALVTGGSKGLGYAMSAGLASAGAQIVIINRNEEEGRKSSQELADEYGVQAMALGTDVTKEKDVEKAVSVVLEEFGRIDILINNAGINIRGPIDELSLDQFRDVMRVNVDGMWLMTRAAIPHMKQRMKGKIINIASTLGLVGLANRTPYASSKGAVLQMTRTLGLELAPWSINVNAICPGPFLTEMNIPIKDTEDAKKNVIGATALKRWGELREIQGAALLLASDASDYMVGSVITVDGGWTAR
jgi:gluconate 5-dehydrogenase